MPPEPRIVGVEARKSIAQKEANGFLAKYLSGANILDIGYRGYAEDIVPIVPQAIGVDLNYPGYDGRTLPFGDNSQDAVFSSHCLEHIEHYKYALREWHRVLKIGGFMIITVPHQFLYEKRARLPSNFNRDHKRFYTPASLMAEIESSLAPNTYRVRHLADNDEHFDYTIPPEKHPGGCYELETVIEKIRPPEWKIQDAENENHEMVFAHRSDLIEWRSGFAEREPGFRWTIAESAALQFDLSGNPELPARARIVLVIDTFGKQRIVVRFNGIEILNTVKAGKALSLKIPVTNLRSGVNTIELNLPDAAVAGDGDPRQLGVAIRRVRLLSDRHPDRRQPLYELWRVIAGAWPHR